MIDLRSDTVTKPSDAMRRAMASAEVGDDVFEEDPTVRRLEDRVAGLLGFGAALFVPSGTMGNQIAIRLLAPPGTEVILESRAHIFHYEVAGMAALSGLLPRPVASRDGILDAADVLAAVQPDVSYKPRTALLTLENTHNLWGGRIYRREQLEPLLDAARSARLAIHLDGSRLWNAAAALGQSEASLAAGFDSVMVTFSKGLGAPIGSALAGSAALVKEARRVRKLFGGGMRQVGVLAAAALLALENRSRLTEDHENARRLARGLADAGAGVDPKSVETNIVLFDVADARHFTDALKGRGVLVSALSPTTVRLVTHQDVSAADVERALGAMQAVLKAES